MELGGWIFGGLAVIVLGVLGLRVALMVAVKRAAGKLRGQPLPALPGATGKAMKGRSRGLLYFYSPGCGACRAMTPVVQELNRRDPGVQLVDVSRDMETARAFGILGTPTVVSVREGAVADVVVGPIARPRIEALAGI